MSFVCNFEHCVNLQALVLKFLIRGFLICGDLRLMMLVILTPCPEITNRILVFVLVWGWMHLVSGLASLRLFDFEFTGN